jgi:poly-gamma-glutamate capsule biosynthesis protein CapA/YwtB (metallophosphatase superfamily)
VSGGHRLLFVGDLILDEPDPDSFFDPCRTLLASADLVVGQVEVPHTSRGVPSSVDVPAPPADPAHLAALARAGIRVATLAGNHIFDSGPAGVEDTLATLRGLGIATAGAGMNLEEARRPAVVEAGGLSVGVLSYNCVGPRESRATSRKAGAAPLDVLTHYELDHAGPGGPPRVYTFVAPESLEALRADVLALRDSVDVAVVAFHKGVGHVPVEVSSYERELGRTAVDCGADVVVGHHAHILRGIEMYRGRPIFHGLGNFVTVTHALTPDGGSGAELAAWARRRRELFGFEPDPAMPFYPFHPESRNTLVADCRVGKDGALEAGFVPCWIDDHGRPVPAAHDEGGEEVEAYVEQITAAAGFGTAFAWDGERVVVTQAAGMQASGSASGP